MVVSMVSLCLLRLDSSAPIREATTTKSMIPGLYSSIAVPGLVERTCHVLKAFSVRPLRRRYSLKRGLPTETEAEALVGRTPSARPPPPPSAAKTTTTLQVTHPEVTTEHVLGAASSLVLALAAFLVRAAADLTIDACGAVIPSLCGTREARLAAAHSRIQAAGVQGGEGGGGGGSSGGAGGNGAGEAHKVGQDGGPGVVGGKADGALGEGHELDQYFIL